MVSDVTRYIREVLSERKDSIDILLAKDSEFLELCEDHDTCVDALNYWRNSAAPEAADRVREYGEILGRLYSEIAGILEN